MGSENSRTEKKYLGSNIDGKLTYLGSEVLRAKQRRIQTGAIGCRKPMKTANLNLIQYINLVLGKNNYQGHDSIFRRGDNFVQIREN